MIIEHRIEIEFGDCDPAGIVFYPRYFSWFDATFQKWMRSFDLEQKNVSENLGSVGTGLMDAGARFLKPAYPGNTLLLSGQLESATNRSFRMRYRGHIGDQLCLEGYEVRGLFIYNDERLSAAPLDKLWALMGITPPSTNQ